MKVEKILALALLFALLTCGDEAFEVSINYPVDGALVSGILRILADASDNVASVSFCADDSCLGVARAAPFLHIWNTFILPDSSSHIIYAIAEDRKGNEVYSDSVSVMVYNGNVVFADDFESYLPNRYPDAGWFEIWMGAGSNHTYVDSSVANSGTQSLRLRGLTNWVRTDGVELVLSDVDHLTYETSLMIPSQEPTGALFGFFVLINPQVGTIYNGIWFSYTDSSVYARGIVEDSTGYIWRHDTWYSVKVTLDYTQLKMNTWLNDEQIVFDLPAVPLNWTDTFALATEYGNAGIVYYDDISIFETGDSIYAHPASFCPVP
ncbi:MAG: Ig-like domain-containing protein [bacterium]